MLNVPSALLLGLVALIAAGGCGTGAPTVPPPTATASSVPSTLPPGPPSPSFSNSETEHDPNGPSFGPPPPEYAPKKLQELVPQELPGYRRSFDLPLRAPAVATGDPELDPLVSYLKASFSVAIKEGHRLVIDDTTDVGILREHEPYQEYVDKLLRHASDQVPAALIRDFGDKNRKSHVLWPELPRHLRVSLLTMEERKGLFEGNSLNDGWKRFYAKYPGSPGIITVSRVGLNSDKTLAMFDVAVGEGMLSGHGQIHVLKKEGDVWVEVAVLSSWTA